jgi:hypothetical protein
MGQKSLCEVHIRAPRDWRRRSFKQLPSLRKSKKECPERA